MRAVKPESRMNLRARSRRPSSPRLRFSPTAWAKLVYLRDCGDTEIGGFGIASSADPLWIEDVRLVRQECTAVTVAFDEASVADLFDEMVDRGLRPECFARVWLHTHPGNSAEPSSVDEETFARSFGNTDWAVMAILARGGQRFARLQFHVGPGGSLALPVQVDYARPFPAADPAAWEAEYLQCVQPVMPSHPGPHWLEPIDADADFSLSPWGELAWGWEPDFEERSGSRDESRTL